METAFDSYVRRRLAPAAKLTFPSHNYRLQVCLKDEYPRQRVIDGLPIEHYHFEGRKSYRHIEMKDVISSREYQMFFGVDGCKVGWFAVGLTEEAKWQAKVFPDISSLWNQYRDARLILIDVPIGLRDTDSSERHCDKEARALLSPERKPSVFVSPCRAAVYAATNEEAKIINTQKTGRSLSVQTLAIIPKIRQVDQLLTSNKEARSHIRETHPELCFWALNNGISTVFRKKDKRGIEERKEILTSAYPQTSEVLDYSLQQYARKDVAEDDILDALAAAVTASRKGKGLLAIPDNPEFDSEGLPMEMVVTSYPFSL